MNNMKVILYSVMRFAYKAYDKEFDLKSGEECFIVLKEGLEDAKTEVEGIVDSTKKYLLGLVFDERQKEEDFLMQQNFTESILSQECGIIFNSICELMLMNIRPLTASHVSDQIDRMGQNGTCKIISDLRTKASQAQSYGGLILQLKTLIDFTVKKFNKIKTSEAEKEMPHEAIQLVEQVNQWIDDHLPNEKIDPLNQYSHLSTILLTTSPNQIRTLVEKACQAYN